MGSRPVRVDDFWQLEIQTVLALLRSLPMGGIGRTDDGSAPPMIRIASFFLGLGAEGGLAVDVDGCSDQVVKCARATSCIPNHKRSLQPQDFDKGDKEAKNPRTGGTVGTKARGG